MMTAIILDAHWSPLGLSSTGLVTQNRKFENYDILSHETVTKGTEKQPKSISCVGKRNELGTYSVSISCSNDQYRTSNDFSSIHFFYVSNFPQ